MKRSITGALAFLLFAGVSTAALAQDHDHDRGRGGGQPQGRQGPPQAAPPVAPALAPGQGQGQGHARFAPAQPGAVAPAERPRFQGGASGERRFDADRRFQGDRRGDGDRRVEGGRQFDRDHRGDGDRRFQGDRRGDGDRRVEGGRQFDRDHRGDGDRRFDGDHRFDGDRRFNGDRGFDRGGAPHEVIPPGRGERGDRDHDRRGPEFGRWNGTGAPHWNHGEHWQRGRLPPVFWSQHRYHLGRYRAPYGFYARDWGFGDFLPSGWFVENYWIGDFLDYDLPYPPPGYVWVRVGGDAIMVDRFSGRIVQIVRGIFW